MVFALTAFKKKITRTKNMLIATEQDVNPNSEYKTYKISMIKIKLDYIHNI